MATPDFLEQTRAMTLHVGVIGVGVMGGEHARNLASAVAGGTLEALADADAARVAKIAEELGRPRTFVDPLELVADRKVDAVVIASPEHTHADLVLACIGQGKPVLCEKPLAANVADCRRVVAAEVNVGRRLVQVGFMRRFDSGYRAMRDAVVEGRYGAPLLMHCTHRNALAPAFLNRDDMLITSAAVHEIDATRWLFGEEIARVTVMLPRPANDRGLHDPQLLLLETAGGGLADVEIFMNARFGSEVSAELVCASGTLALVPPVTTLVRHDGHLGQTVPAAWLPRFAAAYRSQLQAWIDAVADGGIAGEAASAWDGYAASAVAEAGVAALLSGKPTHVNLDERPSLYA